MRSVVAVLVVIVGLAGVAHADERARLVLVAPPPPLEDAVRSSLAPWRVVIMIEQPEKAVDAATVSSMMYRRHAQVIAWIEGKELVVLDKDGQVVRRPAAKIDDANAAALALTIKTMLRLPPTPPPLQPDELPPPIDPKVTTVMVPVPITVEAPTLWRVDVGLGARWLSEGAAEPRLTVTGQRRMPPVVLAVNASAGSGFDLSGDGADSLSGSRHDLTLGAAVLLPIAVAEHIQVSPGAGGSLRLVQVDGSYGGQGANHREVSESHPTIGVDGGVDVIWWSGRWAAGARAGVTWLPLRLSFHDTKGGTDRLLYQVSRLEAELAAFGAVSF